MIKKLSLILSLIFTCNAVQAENNHKDHRDYAPIEETTGFLSGVIVGGFAGGPPGAIFAASIGAILGENWNRNKIERNGLETALQSSELKLSNKNSELETLRKQYEATLAKLDQYQNLKPTILPASLNSIPDVGCCDDTMALIHFRTGQNNIEPIYEEQLLSMADLIKQIPNISVEITGYADRNGDSKMNFELSNQRSDSVKSFFLEEGVDATSISTNAYGETRPVDVNKNFESDFFDRRVVVHLRNNNRSLLTKAPESK